MYGASTITSPISAQVTLVGWFALVLGLAFLVQYAVRRAKAKSRQP